MDEEIKEEIKVELESNASDLGLNIYSAHSSVIFQQSEAAAGEELKQGEMPNQASSERARKRLN